MKLALWHSTDSPPESGLGLAFSFPLPSRGIHEVRTLEAVHVLPEILPITEDMVSPGTLSTVPTPGPPTGRIKGACGGHWSSRFLWFHLCDCRP